MIALVLTIFAFYATYNLVKDLWLGRPLWVLFHLTSLFWALVMLLWRTS